MFIDDQVPFVFPRKLVDEYYKRQNLTNDAFYFGLEQEIQRRQLDRVPIAGQSGYEFFTFLGQTVFWAGKTTRIIPIAALGKALMATGEFALGYNPDIEPIR